MPKKPSTLLAASATFAALSVSMVFQACSEAQKDDITVGVIVPVTSSISVWGVNSQRGIQLAADQINAAGGIDGRQIRLIVEDSECDPEKATAILRRLIDEHHVAVVLGNICSSNVLAMAPIAESSEVVLLSTGASNPAISEAGDFVFRNWPSDHIQGQLTAEHAFESGHRAIAIFFVDNAYGQGLDSEFREHFQELGGEISLTPSESYTEGDVDFRAQLATIKESGADGLYLPAYTKEYPLILEQIQELELDLPIMASETFDDPETIELAGPAAHGVVFPSPASFDKTTPQGRRFAEAFEATYGDQPGVTADTAFDAMNIVAEALSAGAETGPAIRDFLYEHSHHEGVAGLAEFDAKGDSPKKILFYRVAEGVAEPLK